MPHLVQPEPLHAGGLLQGLRVGQQDSLHHSAEVTQVEEIVRLGGRGQQAGHCLLVDGQRPINNLVHTTLELIRKAPVNIQESEHCETASTVGLYR